MKKNRICELLSIRYPVIQAPMSWVTNAELVAAVSNAGGLGVFGPNAGEQTITPDVAETGERLRRQLRRAKELTDKPFGVNIMTFPRDEPYSDRCVDVLLEEGVAAVFLCGNQPERYTRKLKESGVRVFHRPLPENSVEAARKAEQAGIDGLVAVGFDGGGHLGYERLPTFVLVPQIVDAVKIPVIAGGGVMDGRGMVAAMALGAEGVYLGTRFIAATECPAHLNYKRAIIEAGDTGTATCAGIVGVLRSLKTPLVEHYLQLETSGRATSEDHEALFRSVSGAWLGGDISKGALPCCAGAGLVKEIKSVSEIMQDILREAGRVRRDLNW